MAFASPGLADEVIYSTGSPYGGPMGVTGFDVFDGQSVAARFVPAHDCVLTSISLWLMTNNPQGVEVAPTLSISLREDAAASGAEAGPAGQMVVDWACATGAMPFAPSQHVLVSEGGVMLTGGREYWIVAESATVLQRNPIWNWSGEATGYIGLQGTDGVWSCGPGVAMTVEVRADWCPSADFNGDTDVGTDADIEAFFACLAGNCCESCQSADFNRDGDWATDADIELFFRTLAGRC
jgi:hypothetical protein